MNTELPTDRVTSDLSTAATMVGSEAPAGVGLPAGFWRRYGAALIDGLVVQLALIVVAIATVLAIGLEGLGTPTGQLIASVVTTGLPLVGTWLYYAIAES